MRNKKVVLTSVNKSDSKYTPGEVRAFDNVIKKIHVMTLFCSTHHHGGKSPGTEQRHLACCNVMNDFITRGSIFKEAILYTASSPWPESSALRPQFCQMAAFPCTMPSLLPGTADVNIM